MRDLFSPITASVGHVAARRQNGDAALTVITPKDFATARDEIMQWEGYAATPLERLTAMAQRIGVGEILYKHEGPRFGLGSFKALGGSYAALRVLQREISRKTGADVRLSDIRNGGQSSETARITLASATDGNHGRSLAWGCKRFGAPCRIYIHAEVSNVREQAMRDLGAEVIRIDGDYDASVSRAQKDAQDNGWFVVSDTSWPGYTDPPRDVMAGYGVMTQEICEALKQPPSHVFLQAGVGGLAAGVVAGLVQYWGDNAPRMITVEPEFAPCLFESAKAGQATTVQLTHETIMAGLSCGEPSALAWDILVQNCTDFLTIPDSLIAPTMRLLAQPLTGDPVIEAGESAVAGLAAVIAVRGNVALSQKLGLDESSQILLIGSEGVTDPEIFAKIMAGDDGV